MLKRIAVAGQNEELMQSLTRAAEGTDALLKAMAPGEALPSGTAAVLAAADEAGAGLDAALAAGAEHEVLLGLIADTVSIREEIPPGDSERVRAHAARFGQALDLSPDEQLTLERGALLRDIGKLKIDNDVLIK